MLAIYEAVDVLVAFQSWCVRVRLFGCRKPFEFNFPAHSPPRLTSLLTANRASWENVIPRRAAALQAASNSDAPHLYDGRAVSGSASCGTVLRGRRFGLAVMLSTIQVQTFSGSFDPPEKMQGGAPNTLALRRPVPVTPAQLMPVFPGCHAQLPRVSPSARNHWESNPTPFAPACRQTSGNRTRPFLCGKCRE